MNYLCLDYGEQHTGLAYSQGFLAEPLYTLPTSLLLTKITSIIADFKIETLVIGLSENLIGEKTKVFAKKIETLTGLPVIFHDETLSSQDTRRNMAQMGMKKKRREGKIDHLVAAAILDDYLDSQ
jgi:putative transcription antitermination factor YqgF